MAKYHFLVSDFWQAVSRGCLPFLAVCYGLFDIDSFVPLALSFVVMLFVASLQCTKDFPDLAGDRKFGVPTLPAKLGEAGAVKVMAVLASISFLSLGFFICAGVLSVRLSLLFVLAIPTGAVLISVRSPKEHRLVENTLQWVGYYAILGLFYVLPPIALL
jgi:4-hydroxybenzoate polyprenyltransferase